MSSLNKVTLIGYLGRDPEIRYLPNGTPTATVNVATTENWKDRETGEPKERTDWHRLVFYRKLAEVVGQYLVKGSQIYVEGQLRTRSYRNEDGDDVYVTEVHVAEMLMLGGKRKEGTKGDVGRQQEEERDADVPY